MSVGLSLALQHFEGADGAYFGIPACRPPFVNMPQLGLYSLSLELNMPSTSLSLLAFSFALLCLERTLTPMRRIYDSYHVSLHNFQ